MTAISLLEGTNPLLVLSVVLTAGVTFGAVAKRLRLPSVTGQILIGILLGRSVLDLFSAEAVEAQQPVTHFALGLIAVTVGSHLNFFRLRAAAKRLSILALLEALLTPALVLVACRAFGLTWSLSALLAAMAVETAPATTIAVVKDSRAKGVFVKTLMAAVALNNVLCLTLFEAANATARASTGTGAGLGEVVLAPLAQLAGSALLGGAVGLALIGATRRILRRDRMATASIIGILLTIGLADHLQISSLLACLFLGTTLANVTPDRDELGHRVFADFESAIFAVFFTLAGMELDLHTVVTGGGVVAVAIVVARFAGKYFAATVAMHAAGAPTSVRRNLGLALVPQAGVTVGLIFLVREEPALAAIHEPLLAIGLTAVTLNEIIGPVLMRLALQRSGDFGKDRARLIDFLHEENIVTDLEADTKEEAIERLTQVMIQSNHLKDDSNRLLRSILDREAEISTCVGGGLAVPHGVLESGNGIVGAMGISQRGLRFDTPDGLPVHCMVVLGTPAKKRDQHLEVLAALARAIGMDPNVQRQLFNARSPAHAYEILHAEEAEDFNYFLEEE